MATRTAGKRPRNMKNQRIRPEKRLKNLNVALYQDGLFFISEIVKTKFINKYYDNLLVGYFYIEKTQELIA